MLNIPGPSSEELSPTEKQQCSVCPLLKIFKHEGTVVLARKTIGQKHMKFICIPCSKNENELLLFYHQKYFIFYIYKKTFLNLVFIINI